MRKEYERRLAASPNSGAEALLKKQVQQAQRAVDRLIDAYAAGLVEREEFEPRVQRARERLTDAKTKLDNRQTHLGDQSALREALQCLDDFSEQIHTRLDDADWEMRREILRTLIDRVQVEKDQIRIVYRINFPLFARRASNEKVLHFCWRRAPPGVAVN